MANFVSHTHFCRHLFEFSGKVLILDGGLSLVKCRESYSQMCADMRFFRSSCWKELSKSVWEFQNLFPEIPGKTTQKSRKEADWVVLQFFLPVIRALALYLFNLFNFFIRLQHPPS